jgi:hypothetical protein
MISNSSGRWNFSFVHGRAIFPILVSGSKESVARGFRAGFGIAATGRGFHCVDGAAGDPMASLRFRFRSLLVVQLTL